MISEVGGFLDFGWGLKLEFFFEGNKKGGGGFSIGGCIFFFFIEGKGGPVE